MVLSQSLYYYGQHKHYVPILSQTAEPFSHEISVKVTVIKWQDKIPNTVVLVPANWSGEYTVLTVDTAKVRMSDTGLPKQGL